ncbi:hypothetical protein A1O7_00619 [Cladophialophora yegresii CBS 114405]|uniref:Ig-like domain-containing protein n=1 Tax=Cladophialophora yegresii CBS 114405 TaxID=1182544 RepID=W9W8H9_9EURO|nr:uncharacterized protein A1O7_00619 [Cladophialophora yegresii CBS 114405]EXJ64283.1 hypothetical protein A1O7_00619 [Cladophialophora yegresii CBS 114405]
MFFVRSLTVVFTAALFLSTQAWKNEDEVVTVTKTNTHYVCPCITDTPLTPSPDSHEWTEWEGDHSASGSGWVTSPTGKDTKTPKGPTGSGTTSPTPGDHHHTWPTSKPGSVPTSSGTWTTTKRSRRPTSGTSSSTSSKTKSTTQLDQDDFQCFNNYDQVD